MTKLPKIADLSLKGKRVLVRADLDLGEDVTSDARLEALVPTLKDLMSKSAKIILIGHRGRPGGVRIDGLSLRDVAKRLSRLLKSEVLFVDEVEGEKVTKAVENMKDSEVLMLENLRFDEREEKNDEEFAKKLASFGDIYVNEAFANSHRNHASIVALPSQAKFKSGRAVGLHFEKEIVHLDKVLVDAVRPLITIISGVKNDKMKYVEDFVRLSDKVLIGGRLPEYIHDDSPLRKNEKILVAGLIADKEDISINTIESFEKEIKKAKSILINGPLGKFEEDGHTQGTKRVLSCVSNTDAFKVAGGGETVRALEKFEVKDKFDWVSLGGGSMLEYLTKGALPGIQALLN